MTRHGTPSVPLLAMGSINQADFTFRRGDYDRNRDRDAQSVGSGLNRRGRIHSGRPTGSDGGRFRRSQGNAEVLREKIEKAIKKVRQDQGVLILTDMFGGTPSNLSYSFLEDGKVEVLSGVNLPMLIKANSARQEKRLSDLALTLEVFGKRSISLASGILKGNKRSE